LGVLATLALAPLLLKLLRLAIRSLESFWPAIGHLTTRFFRLRPFTFAVALTAISTLVGTLVTVFLLIETTRSAFEYWAESRFPGAPILVLPFSLYDPISSDLLSPETLAAIRTSTGVVAVNEQYNGYGSVLFRRQEVPLRAMTMDAVAKHGRLPSVGRPPEELARDLSNGKVAVSPGFVKAFGLTTGDSFELDTQHGVRRFEIAGIYEDFGESTGSILLDLATFDSCWKRSGATSATVWVDVPAEVAITGIRRHAGTHQDLYFANASEIVAANRQVTEVFSSTLHVLGAFISLLGAIGVMILLAGVIAERRRDLAVLRAAGAEPRQLVTVILVDALALGFLGTICGVALGLACADPASDILRESYGWILEQQWTAPELPFLVVGGVASAVIGALIPARMAYHTTPDDVFVPE
jgi:putative ABC transport system permease protein